METAQALQIPRNAHSALVAHTVMLWACLNLRMFAPQDTTVSPVLALVPQHLVTAIQEPETSVQQGATVQSIQLIIRLVHRGRTHLV